MKQYDVNYKVNDDVYILISNTIIYKTQIEKIRITEQAPYYNINDVEKRDGIDIDYLVAVNENGNMRTYDWINQDEIYKTRTDVIVNIK